MTNCRLKHTTCWHRCTAIVWLVLVFNCAVAQVSNAGADCSSPEAVLQRYIDAVGGEAAAQHIETRLTEAEEYQPATYKPTSMEHFKYRFKWKAPNKVVFRHTDYWFGFPARTFLGMVTFKFDGQNWSDFQGRATRNEENTPLWRRKLKADYPMFDYPQGMMARVVADPLMLARSKEFYSSFEVSNDVKASPGDCVLRASLARSRLRDTLTFDAQSGLLKTWEIEDPIQQPSKPHYYHFQFGDYRQVGDVKFPFYIYFDFYQATFRFTKVVHNPRLADSDFALKAVKPDGH
jgi:hypothetical protein